MSGVSVRNSKRALEIGGRLLLLVERHAAGGGQGCASSQHRHLVSMIQRQVSHREGIHIHTDNTVARSFSSQLPDDIYEASKRARYPSRQFAPVDAAMASSDGDTAAAAAAVDNHHRDDSDKGRHRSSSASDRAASGDDSSSSRTQEEASAAAAKIGMTSPWTLACMTQTPYI